MDALMRMAHSGIANYVIPGLTSYLIGGNGPQGRVRLFTCSRQHEEPISPHSHRFDFQCIVLRGSVSNRIWRRVDLHVEDSDSYRETVLRYCGDVGRYVPEAGPIGLWQSQIKRYMPGDCYGMKADEVHSISFSRGAAVLFFEGPTVASHSIVLEPVVDGEVVPTFEVRPWMFRRKEAQA